MPSQEGPGAQLFIALCEGLSLGPSPWESEFQPSFLNGEDRLHHGRGSPAALKPAGHQAVLKLQEGSQLFWGSPAHRSQRPHCSVGLLVGGSLMSVFCLRLRIVGAERLDQDPNLAGAEGSSGAHGEVGGF